MTSVYGPGVGLVRMVLTEAGDHLNQRFTGDKRGVHTEIQKSGCSLDSYPSFMSHFVGHFSQREFLPISQAWSISVLIAPLIPSTSCSYPSKIPQSVFPADCKFRTFSGFLLTKPTSAPAIYWVFMPGDMSTSVKTDTASMGNKWARASPECSPARRWGVGPTAGLQEKAGCPGT